MTPPAALPPLPAAPGVRSAPVAAAAPRGDAAPGAFDQHLQAARGTPPADAAPPADQPPASAPDACAQGESSAAGAAAKPVPESSMPTRATTPAASAVGTPSTAAAAVASRGQADATSPDTALAVTQATPVAAASADAAAPAAPKAPSTTKPDDEAAATLAGAMLALLGRVTGGMAGASSDAGDATVSADGSASNQAKAAAVPQGSGPDDKTLAAAVAAAAPAINQAGMPASVERLFAPAGSDTRKDHGLEVLAWATAPTPTPTPATQAPALPQLQLSSPPGSTGFADELGQQVVWLGQQDIRQAKIRLHPDDLGSLDVHLSVSHDRVDVVFSAQHPAAVTAVQQSLPQLDHMLARHGLSLGHAEVGQQQNHGDGRAHGEGRDAAPVDEIGEAHGASLPVATSRIGLLDAFA